MFSGIVYIYIYICAYGTGTRSQAPRSIGHPRGMFQIYWFMSRQPFLIYSMLEGGGLKPGEHLGAIET